MATENVTATDKSPIKPTPEPQPRPRPRLPLPPPPDATDLISIPSYSRWFSWDNIHQCELRFLPEFFDGRSASKNPKVYKYYRNAIVRTFRHNPTRKITFTEVRKTIIGDVGSIRRVFDFLEAWGLINYTPSSNSASSSKPHAHLKWEDNKDSKSSSSSAAAPTQAAAADAAAGAAPSSADSAATPSPSPAPAPKKSVCSGCKALCTIACFASEKHDLTLCARCYVRGNYRVGLCSSDFKRVEISDEVKSDWTDKETLHLLEALMHYGDDWKKVAAHVNGRSERDCVAHFVKLPFGEQFVGPPESTNADSELGPKNSSSPNKRMRLSPLGDASNPIMAQAAFLSALVGVEVAEVASHAAVMSLSDSGDGNVKENLKSLPGGTKKQESEIVANGDTISAMDSALVEAQLQLEKEEDDLEKELSGIAVQMKEIQDKLVRFEELDLQLEREWQQFQQLKNLLFVDQLNLIFHKVAAQKSGESTRDKIEVE